MKPPSIEDLFLNPKRKRILGYPVITMAELNAFFEENPFPLIRESVFGKTMLVYGLPVLNESQAFALESAVKTLAFFMKYETFPERVISGFNTVWKDEIE